MRKKKTRYKENYLLTHARIRVISSIHTDEPLIDSARDLRSKEMLTKGIVEKRKK